MYIIRNPQGTLLPATCRELIEKEGSMPVYVTLYKWTDSGAKSLKDAPKRIAESSKATEQFGGKLIGLWVTMGEYDLVSVAEWPNDEAAATTSLAISSRGNARTLTMRAFNQAEFAEMAKKLP